jgi:cold-inducible RNA-binding protein
VGKKLFVGNLKFEVDDQSLADIFSGFGEVESARVITDRSSGRSKGFGFVEMKNDDEAARAIEELDGKEHEGRPLTVNEARPREDRGNRGGGRY